MASGGSGLEVPHSGVAFEAPLRVAEPFKLFSADLDTVRLLTFLCWYWLGFRRGLATYNSRGCGGVLLWGEVPRRGLDGVDVGKAPGLLLRHRPHRPGPHDLILHRQDVLVALPDFAKPNSYVPPGLHVTASEPTRKSEEHLLAELHEVRSVWPPLQHLVRGAAVLLHLELGDHVCRVRNQPRHDRVPRGNVAADPVLEGKFEHPGLLFRGLYCPLGPPVLLAVAHRGVLLQRPVRPQFPYLVHQGYYGRLLVALDDHLLVAHLVDVLDQLLSSPVRFYALVGNDVGEQRLGVGVPHCHCGDRSLHPRLADEEVVNTHALLLHLSVGALLMWQIKSPTFNTETTPVAVRQVRHVVLAALSLCGGLWVPRCLRHSRLLVFTVVLSVHYHLGRLLCSSRGPLLLSCWRWRQQGFGSYGLRICRPRRYICPCLVKPRLGLATDSGR